MAVRDLVISALLLVLALMLTILACTVLEDHNAYPLLPLMFYLFVPVPMWLCAPRQSSFSTGASGLQNLGCFLIGIFAASGPSITVVLYHTGFMSLGAMLMSFGSAFLLGSAGAFLGHSFKKQDDLGF
jgi:hypothetical protein